MTRLRAEGVTRVFGSGTGAVDALRGVDLEVGRGELVVVRGASGSGKTTLLTLLGGLEQPTAGTVRLDGEDLARMPEHELLRLRRTRLAFVFQTFGLVPVLTAAENVEVPLRLLDVPAAERERRVAAALDSVGLAPHALQRPGELSGGQQQRVGIARALVAEPEVLLADEPTAQLDSGTAGIVMDLVADLTRRRGVATVVTTHDPLLADRADRVLELRSGVLHG